MVTFNAGQRTDSRTRDMLAEAERRSGREVVVVQGSYSDGKFSAGTHSGGGVVDIRTWNQPSQSAITELVRWLREVGFAAWQRPDMGGGPHIHAVAISCPDLHSSARSQVTAYRNGRDGLAANGPDRGPKVPFRAWEQYQSENEPEEDPFPSPQEIARAMWATPVVDPRTNKRVSSASMLQSAGKCMSGVIDLKASPRDTLAQATNAKVGAVQAREESTKSKSAAVAARDFLRTIFQTIGR